jgi:hypothetical protein
MNVVTVLKFDYDLNTTTKSLEVFVYILFRSIFEPERERCTNHHIYTYNHIMLNLEMGIKVPPMRRTIYNFSR